MKNIAALFVAFDGLHSFKSEESRVTNPQETLRICQKLAESGQIDQLTKTLDKAVEAFPNHAEFTAMRAKIMIQAGRIDQARHDLEKTIQLNPFDGDSFDNLGVIEQMNGNYLRASELHLTALNSAPNNTGFLFNLAVALEKLGQTDQATNLYQGILEIDPAHTKSMVNLASHYEKNQDNDKAIALLQKAIKAQPHNFEALMGLGNIYRKLNLLEDAKIYYTQATEADPSQATAKFMLANVTGETPDHAPEDYIANLFDDFADSFEEKLVGELEYRAPSLLHKAIAKDLSHLKSIHSSLKAIDLGAGTGLFGKLIRNDVTLSIGVDLAQKMLDKAQEKEIYDNVLCVDLIKGLTEQNDHSCHLISAADVFVYVGALDELFQQIKRVLHPDGIFTFTIEILDDSETDDFTLLETARYAHHTAYIEALAKTHGFIITHDEKTWLRINKKAPINGAVYVLKKK